MSWSHGVTGSVPPLHTFAYCAGRFSICAKVEDHIGLQEWDPALDVVAGVVGLLPDDAVGVHDGCAVLALPDMRAELEGLAVGYPDESSGAAVDRLAPHQQHVDSSVEHAVMPPGTGDTGATRRPRI